MKKVIKIVFIFFLVLLILQFVSFSYHVNIFLPSPLEVLQAAIYQFVHGTILLDIVMSLKRVMVGFILAIIIAVPLAMICGSNKIISNFIRPIVEILRPIPPIAWIPIAILLFGLGDKSAYFIVFLGSFFPIFSNTYFGIISLPNVYNNVTASFEIKKWVFITRILFYFTLPYIFTGLKIGIGMAWMSLVASELIGSQSGLGYFIQINRLTLRIDNVVLGMILIGLVGYLLSYSLVILEKIMTPWNKK